MRYRPSLTTLLCLCLATLAPVLDCAAAPQVASAEDYARRPAVKGVALSPDGTHLAMVMRMAGGRAQLVVADLAKIGAAKPVAGFDDADVYVAYWVNSDRLVFQVVSATAALNEARSVGLYAINRDGTGRRELIAAEDTMVGAMVPPSKSRVLPWNWGLHATVNDGSPDVIVEERVLGVGLDFQGTNLWRLNTVTGLRRSLSHGAPANVQSWLLGIDNQPHALVAQKEGRSTVYWREGDNKPWAAVAEFSSYGGTDGEGFDPQFVDGNGQFYVLARRGRDTAALYRFDPLSKALASEPTISLQGFDLVPGMVVDPASRRLLGVHVRMEQNGTYWFDDDLRRVQQSVDAALPGRVNRLQCGLCAGARFLVVESSSDRNPGEYYLLDRKSMQLQFIAASRPWLEEASQGRRSYHRVAARDGLSLPVYLTRPAAAPEGKALATVVLVHGGPYVRGHDLRWSQEAQFLASRGYLVIEVEFRGSMGYGLRHFLAGRKQWGRAMQDDLADALDWAVKQGHADAKRVCIMGTSYGGYAALMGPIRHPGVYQCAISLAGVTDINLMYGIDWSDLSDAWKRYGMPELIGDRVADADQLNEASPLKQVSRFKVPLLLAHGGQDVRVPVEHSIKFRAAAEKNGVQVEWVGYAREMHGLFREDNEADFLRRVEAFLARVLGPASTSGTPATP